MGDMPLTDTLPKVEVYCPLFGLVLLLQIADLVITHYWTFSFESSRLEISLPEVEEYNLQDSSHLSGS